MGVACSAGAQGKENSMVGEWGSPDRTGSPWLGAPSLSKAEQS